MYRAEITIDVERLKKDLKEECLGACFGGGFGGALVESADMDRATPEQLVKMARDRGYDLRRYQA